MNHARYALLAAVLLAGCSNQDDVQDQKANPSFAANYGSVELVTLSNGTVCALYHGYNQGGIDCNWGSK